MYIVNLPRSAGKTSMILIWAAGCAPSTILVPNKRFANILNDKLIELYRDYPEGIPDVKIEVFSDFYKDGYKRTGVPERRLFIDDLDICLDMLLNQKVELASVTERVIKNEWKCL